MVLLLPLSLGLLHECVNWGTAVGACRLGTLALLTWLLLACKKKDIALFIWMQWGNR